MSKNQDLGLEFSNVRILRDFLLARVPLRAAVIEIAGDLTPNAGGTKRRRDSARPSLLGFVGERPAAGGAETGVLDFCAVSSRGVDRGWKARGCDVVLRLYRDGFERDTSVSNEALLRLPARSSSLGSTFSESDVSGEGARRLSEGAEDGAIAIGC